MTSPEPVARERDEVFLELTKSICPVCKTTIDAEVNIRDEQVFLRKRCREHGEFEARVYGDAQMYVDAQRFNKPGTRPLQTQTEVKDGCPQDCGLCPEHKQHACLGIIEVNTGCNLDCPICFADSGSPRENGPDGYAITLEQCATMLDAFVAAEGEPEVVMFSGGEPTIHPDILAMIDLAQERPINAVNLNTNGTRLATDKRFVAELGRRNRPGRRVNVYLQFDGLDEATHRAIRGRDLREAKQRALDNCAEAGLTVTLVAAVEKDVNEHEIGPVVRTGLGHPAVRSVAFQPVTHSGRHVEFDPLTRLTNSDVLHAIVDQLPQWFRADDFFPVPCCAPTCRSITYLITQGRPEDADFGLVPIPRLLQIEDYLDYVSNRVVPDHAIREALEKLWSASAFVGTETNDARLTQVAEALDCADACGVNLPDALAGITDNAFMIVVQDFLDPYTLNVRQLMKCCVEEITPDGRLIPFCAYNSVGYREQVRAQMSGVEVADVVPNATPLQPLLAPTRYGSKQVTPPARPDVDAAEVKACCATGYSSDAVALLLGSSYHPGGLRLTRRLLDVVGVRLGDLIVDVASGIGTTSLLAATEHEAYVDGVDLSEANVALARGAAESAGVADRVRFLRGDAEALPLPDAVYDAVVCECALCTFPDKATAAAEMARVLRPGGRIGITDVTADPERLPPELTGIAAWVACVADARPVEEYHEILAGAGLCVTTVEHHTAALQHMVRQVAARLELLRITSPARLEELGVDLTRAAPVLGAAEAAIRDGILDYVLLVAEKA